MVNAYNKYTKAKFKTGKGFAIFGVSLDKNRNAWKQAIASRQAHLARPRERPRCLGAEAAPPLWDQLHPDELPHRPEGVIVAKNLRGQQLDMELDKYVKSL